MGNDSSILHMWVRTRGKWSLLGIHGFAIAVLFYPWTAEWLPSLSFDWDHVAGSIVSASITMFGLIIAGLAIIVGSGSKHLMGAMYRTKNIHAFMIHFIWIAGSWITTALLGFATLLSEHNLLMSGATASFVYSLLSTLDLVLDLVRFGVLASREASEEALGNTQSVKSASRIADHRQNKN